MPDVEKVIKGLECCAVGAECDHCPYSRMNKSGHEGCYQMHADAFELLKAQEPPKSESISSAIECLLHPQDADDSDMTKAIDTAVRTMRLLKAQEPVVMAGAELTDAELIEEIRKAPLVLKPNVDAVPVVHGRWKSIKANASNNYPFWDSKCSECGYTTAMTQTGWLYCPHCGAKMDGERRDNE